MSKAAATNEGRGLLRSLLSAVLCCAVCCADSPVRLDADGHGCSREVEEGDGGDTDGSSLKRGECARRAAAGGRKNRCKRLVEVAIAQARWSVSV